MQIPRFSTYGLTERDVDELVTQARRSSSMRYNPIVLEDAELGRVLVDAL